MPQIELHNEDCMRVMAGMPDNFIDLAIVDPPYGILDKYFVGGGSHTKSTMKIHHLYREHGKKWDERPPTEYFTHLFRVSKNQIICGANYFVEHLPVSRGWIVWDKQGDGISCVNNELLFSSFDVSIKTFSRCRALDNGFMSKSYIIHPTQKPTALYQWLFHHYAKPGQLILDTHLGSGSSAIAAWYYGCDFVGCELRTDYFNAAKQRIEEETRQGDML